MIRDGHTIDKESARYKFGGDPMAEYLWCLSLDGDADEYDGNASDWHTIGHRFGKRILWNDDQGFVWVTKHDTEAEAKESFEQFAAEYADALYDVTCQAWNETTDAPCSTHFNSEDGYCWCCGARNYTERVR